MCIEFNIVHNEKQREVSCVFILCQSICCIEAILVYLNPYLNRRRSNVT